MRSIVFAVILFGTGLWATDPLIGTWKVNVAKSKYDPGPPPKSVMAVHTEDGEFIVTKMNGVGADGESWAAGARWKKDGRDYPITGQSPWDSVSARHINNRTTEMTYKKGGVVGEVNHIVMAPDGKSNTVTTIKGAYDGKPFHNRESWEKQ